MKFIVQNSFRIYEGNNTWNAPFIVILLKAAHPIDIIRIEPGKN